MKKMLFIIVALNPSCMYATTLECTTNQVPANTVARMTYMPGHSVTTEGHVIAGFLSTNQSPHTRTLNIRIATQLRSPFIGKNFTVRNSHLGDLHYSRMTAGGYIARIELPPIPTVSYTTIEIDTGHTHGITNATSWEPLPVEAEMRMCYSGECQERTQKTVVANDYTRATDKLAFPDRFDDINLIAGETVQMTTLNKTVSTNVIDLSFNSTSADTDNGTLIVNNISVPGQKQTTVPGADRYKLEWKTPTVATPGAQTRTYTVSWTCP